MDQHDPDEARIAHFEKEENFRWITSLLATTSPVELDQLVPESTQEAVYSLAEFAEIAHGSIDPNWVINDENRMFLGDAGFPLEQYPTLTGKVEGSIEPIELIKVFHGGRGQLQGFCALRMQPRSPAHAICNNESPPGINITRSCALTLTLNLKQLIDLRSFLRSPAHRIRLSHCMTFMPPSCLTSRVFNRNPRQTYAYTVDFSSYIKRLNR
ncbi:hypothetical protein FRC20_009517 [Serendipita sp. 405]|nr:hypothetical protein FRC20_009517 [Serendipita sp. 405]